MPLLLCGDPVKLPTGFVPSASWRNTVVFSHDPKDHADGMARVVWENVKSKIAKHLGGDQLGKAAGRALGALGRWLNSPLAEKVFEESGKKAAGKTWDKVFGKARDAALKDIAERTGRPQMKDPMEEILKRLPVVGARPPAVEPATGGRR